MARANSRGFTLIELMIVVLIVGILAGIAYPSYLEQVRKSRRSNCAGELMGLANAMERFYTENATYIGATAAGVYSATCPNDGGPVYYILSITNQTDSTFEIAAAPTGAQATDVCGVLEYTNTGEKRAKGGSVAAADISECWR